MSGGGGGEGETLDPFSPPSPGCGAGLLAHHPQLRLPGLLVAVEHHSHRNLKRYAWFQGALGRGWLLHKSSRASPLPGGVLRENRPASA